MFKFNNLGLALTMALTLYINVARFLRIIKFLEVTVEKLAGRELFSLGVGHPK